MAKTGGCLVHNKGIKKVSYSHHPYNHHHYQGDQMLRWVCNMVPPSRQSFVESRIPDEKVIAAGDCGIRGERAGGSSGRFAQTLQRHRSPALPETLELVLLAQTVPDFKISCFSLLITHHQLLSF